MHDNKQATVRQYYAVSLQEQQ